MLNLFPQFSDRISCRFLGRDDDRTPPTHCVRLDQVHGNRTVIYRKPSALTEKADGVITDTPGLPLIIRASDCQNLAIYAPKQHVLGALHAGWRGIVSGAIPAFFETLYQEWGITPQDTYVAAGPSLCVQCAEFSDPETELPTIDPQFFHERFVDLQAAADDQLHTLGLPADHLERCSECTLCHNTAFLSYRGTDKQDIQAGLSNFLVCSLL